MPALEISTRSVGNSWIRDRLQPSIPRVREGQALHTALAETGVVPELAVDMVEVGEIIEGVRERDRQRFAAQMVGGLMAGRDLLRSNAEDQARESGTVAGPSTAIIAPEEEAKA